MDSTLPYKYMPQEIKELSKDINNIDLILSTNTDTDVKKMCTDLKRKLTESKNYFQTKLAKIPNIHYMEESDEEWVDENKPV